MCTDGLSPALQKLTVLLNKKTERREPFEFELWSNEVFDAFRELKKKLALPLVLALTRHDYKYILDTVPCEYKLGCVVLKEQLNSDELPDERWSRTVTFAERTYSTNDG